MAAADPSGLSPPPPSLGLAVVALLVAVAGLLVIGITGGAVRAGVSDPGLHGLASGALYVALAAGAVTLWLGARSLTLALQSRADLARSEILAARASAARARDSALIVFGLTLALMIGFFLVQMILFNDGKIQKTFLRWDLMTESAADVARAFLVNLKLALIAQVLVMIVGLFLAVARLTPGRAGAPVRMLAIAYIDLFRAVPAIIVLYLIGFGLPLTGLPLISKVSSQWFAIIALTLTYSAYVAEIYRSGIDSIHPSQWSAARSLGFSFPQTMRFFILPQAIRIVIPPLLGAFIALQKDTSLVNVIGTMDAFNQAKFYASANFNLSSVLVVAILFVIITIPQTRFVDWMLERSLEKRKRG
ncbi:amino acid ABC transporter permease [Rhodobacter sp. Har01]|uniref:amino acid ABC transporter permease n=1 Tax=Rhodobacter sp. Har01 TaxID=2883999 RepID=UPI001D063547|nr:amino acid ABC transporter permease [Rhodobacter sp. Har01]MCB6179456.1 amino acid ABC transporter permease [Rhodobacter sp. Har01]